MVKERQKLSSGNFTLNQVNFEISEGFMSMESYMVKERIFNLYGI